MSDIWYEPICGEYMPKADAYCGRLPEHRAEHRSRSAMDRDRRRKWHPRVARRCPECRCQPCICRRSAPCACSGAIVVGNDLGVSMRIHQATSKHVAWRRESGL